MTRSTTLATAVLIATFSFSSAAFAQDGTSRSHGMSQEQKGLFASIRAELGEVLASIGAELREARARLTDLWSDGDDPEAIEETREQITELRHQSRTARREAHAELQEVRQTNRPGKRVGQVDQQRRQRLNQGQGGDQGRRVRGTNGQGAERGQRVEGSNGRGAEQGRRVRGANGRGAAHAGQRGPSNRANQSAHR